MDLPDRSFDLARLGVAPPLVFMLVKVALKSVINYLCIDVMFYPALVCLLL